MHGDVVLEAVINVIRWVVDIFVDFIFTHFLVLFFSEEIVIVIGRLVGVLVELCITGVSVNSMCMSECSEVGGVRAGLVGMLGASVVSSRVVAATVSALDCCTFRKMDSDLGML